MYTERLALLIEQERERGRTIIGPPVRVPHRTPVPSPFRSPFPGWDAPWPTPDVVPRKAAAPTFVGAGTLLSVANGTADGTHTLGSHQTDDIILMWVVRRSTTNTLTTPSGWTLIVGPFNSTAERHYLFGIRCTSSSMTNPLLDWSATSGDFYAQSFIFRGCKTTGTAWGVVGSSQTGTSNNPTLTGITTSVADSLCVVMMGYGDDNNAGSGSTIDFTATDPSAWADVTSAANLYFESTTGADGAIFASHAARSTAGATGDLSTTNFTCTAGDGWGAIVLALEPPTGDTPINAEAGSYAISGQAATTLEAHAMNAEAGVYAITGQSATTQRQIEMNAVAGSYAITGLAATMLVGYFMNAVAGVYAIAGSVAATLIGYLMNGVAGLYSWLGQDAETVVEGSNDTPHNAETGTYSISGQAAATLHGRMHDASAGTYSIAGSSATTLWGRLLNALAGAYSVTGSDADLRTPNVQMVAEVGTYSWLGIAAGTYKGHALNAQAGSYGVTGFVASTLHGRIMNALTGIYEWLGSLLGTFVGVPPAEDPGWLTFYISVEPTVELDTDVVPTVKNNVDAVSTLEATLTVNSH